MENKEILNEIVLGFQVDDSNRELIIPKEKVLQWMKNEDIEALGALYYFIMKEKYCRCIQPPLTFNDYHHFLMNFYGRSLRENPVQGVEESDWLYSRYEAGWDLASWFYEIWKDREVPREALNELKSWMAELYKNGDEAIRNCLVTATLEHLFEVREIAEFFVNWKEDEQLGIAYSESIEWSEKGGHSFPFSK